VFFLQLALAASLGGSAMLNSPAKVGHYRRDSDYQHDSGGVRLQTHDERSTRMIPWRVVIAVGTIAFAVLPAWTLEKPLVPVHLEEVDGMYYADGGVADGVPFRWARKYASVYVPASARVIELPLRWPLTAITKEPTEVEVSLSGKTIANVPVGDTWTYVTVTLPLPEPPLQFSRINLRANHTAHVSDLIPGTEDPREVALQIGDVKIVKASWEYVPRTDAPVQQP